MRNLISLCLVALLVVAFSQPARGQQRQARGVKMLERLKGLDTSGDGKLSKEEAPQRLKEHFDRLDANGDGQLDEAELKQAFGQREGRPDAGQNRRPHGEQARRPGGDQARRPSPEQIRQMIQRVMAADANRDGKLSKDEVPERMKPQFDKMDANHDGQLERDEVLKAFHDRFQQAASPEAVARLLERLKGLDKNGDGKLSKEEVPHQFQARFGQIDGDGDGQLDEKELKTLAQAMAGRSHAGTDGARTRDRAQNRAGGRSRDGDRPSRDSAPAEAVAEIIKRLRASDADGDGTLSKDEVSDQRLKDAFDRADANGDGKLDEAELKRVVRVMAGRRAR